jgi:hypothetical protein
MSQTHQVQVTSPRRVRQALLAGALAGPLYIIVGTLEALFRDGFDIRIHSLSLLANGTQEAGSTQRCWLSAAFSLLLARSG